MITTQHKAQKGWEMADRRRRVAEMMALHLDQTKIMTRLNQERADLKMPPLSRPTVSRDMKAVVEQWRLESVAIIGTIKECELAELAAMEQSCSIQFEDFPDPRWLEIRMRIKDRRAKMLGFDAPTTVDVVDWRKDARAKGIDAATLFERMVQDAARELKNASQSHQSR